MKKRWFIKERADEDKVLQLSKALKVDPILARILVQRGIDDFSKAEQFFRPKLTELHDPFLMKNMDEAMNRIKTAIDNKERVLLYGDYDVDGTTAVSLMWNVLKVEIEELDYYIPDRYKEGYGISKLGIDYASDNDITLIIALDCGIKAHEQARQAKASGIDLIICDHHEPGPNLPDALILNPKQTDCPYPFKELSGCGVGFKLLQAYFKQEQKDDTILLRQLDLLAISISADLVPMTGENRVLCNFGLQLINKKTRPCFKQLLQRAKKTVPLTITDVVFTIAPRINAAGRMDQGQKAVKLMTEEDPIAIETLVEEIENDNLERRALDQETTEEALIQISDDPNFALKLSTVVYQENWHKGVVGIVASRLIEKHYRPTIVLTKSNGKLTGSARSIQGLNLYETLEACQEYLEQFGGHEFAAGLTLDESKLKLFSDAFELEVQKRLNKTDLVPQQIVDHELLFNDIFKSGENIYDLPKFKRIMNQLEPHGPKNMKPVFVSKNVFVESVFLLKEAHLKLRLSQANSSLEIAAIGFNMADKVDLALSKDPIDILYTLEANDWNNQVSLQLQLKDIRSSI